MEEGKLQYAAERRKVICGEKHFRGALGADYRIVTSVNDLP
jgi:hypothetical protein